MFENSKKKSAKIETSEEKKPEFKKRGSSIGGSPFFIRRKASLPKTNAVVPGEAEQEKASYWCCFKKGH